LHEKERLKKGRNKIIVDGTTEGLSDELAAL